MSRRSRSKIRGVIELRRALRKAPEAMRDVVREEIGDTVEDVHRDGLRLMDAMVTRRSGVLRKHYKAKRPSAKGFKGWVGYRGKRAIRAAYYARWVHDGTVKTPSRPFHYRAEQRHLIRFRRAMRLAASHALGRVLK
ncbi:MAG: hypothetical protein AAGM38_18675 [Pseudomonadota bacterium]